MNPGKVIPFTLPYFQFGKIIPHPVKFFQLAPIAMATEIKMMVKPLLMMGRPLLAIDTFIYKQLKKVN